MGLITGLFRSLGNLIARETGYYQPLDNRSFNQTMGQVNLGVDNRASYLEDRVHTEMREDTAYQRAVADMKAAGLNPNTIGASPAASSASSVGSSVVESKLQLLGSLLSLENLNSKNKQYLNDQLFKAFDDIGKGEDKLFGSLLNSK